MMWYWCKHRQIGGTDWRLLKQNSHIYGQKCKGNSVKKGQSFKEKKKLDWKIGYPHAKQKALDHHIQNNSKLIKDLILKPRTIKLLEKYMGKPT